MNKPERVQTGEQIHFPQLRLLNLADGKISVKGTAVKTPTQPQLWVPHISLVFGEMWEMNLLSRLDPLGFVHLEQVTCLGQVKDGMNAAFRLYPVDRSKGAPYLARFWRDVGYRNCLLTHAPRKTEVPWRFCSSRPERSAVERFPLPVSRKAVRFQHFADPTQPGGRATPSPDRAPQGYAAAAVTVSPAKEEENPHWPALLHRHAWPHLPPSRL
jgi:hypothetical protein